MTWLDMIRPEAVHGEHEDSVRAELLALRKDFRAHALAGVALGVRLMALEQALRGAIDPDDDFFVLEDNQP